MTACKIRELKKGDFFTLKPIEEPRESQVYIYDGYDRSARKWCGLKWSDFLGNGRLFKGDTVVYTDFTF